MKKFVAFLLSLAIITSLASSALAMQPSLDDVGRLPQMDTSSFTDAELKVYEKAINQYDAVILYNHLITAFIEKFGYSAGTPECYPDIYAGAYIDDDGKLVIQVTSQNELNKYFSSYVDINAIIDSDPEFKSRTFEDVVKYSEVTYSLNELNRLLDDAAIMFGKNYPLLRTHIDTLNNIIIMEFEPTTYAKFVNERRAALDVKENESSLNDDTFPILFKAGEKPTPHANHVGGQGYYYFGNGGGCTAGFTGWLNGSRVLISCGHSVGTGGNYPKAYYNGTASSNEIGSVWAYSFASGQPGDWSIIQLKSGETAPGSVRNSTSTTVSVSGKTGYVPVNTILYTYGHTTKVWSSYKVLYLDVTGVSGTTNITQCTMITGSIAQSGDSGAPYVLLSGSSYSAYGIHSGGWGGNDSLVSSVSLLYLSSYLIVGP